MRRRSIAIISSVVLAAVIALSGFLATRHAAPGASAFTSPLLGHPAPTFTARTLAGAPVSLESLRGNVVVVNFWASWCRPCITEAPELSSYAWQERHHHVKVLGVVFNDSLSSARNFQATYGSLYPSIVDLGGQIANSYGVTSPPTTFVINASGVVAATLVGSTSAAQLARVVNQVASE